jgi:outer membrane protein OmpA-like peptidoglycan-associated protein
MNYRVSVAVIILLLFPPSGQSQSLVANGGFEDVNLCTEFQQPCAPEGWFYPTFKNIGYEKNPGFAFKGYYCLGYTPYNDKAPDAYSILLTPLICRPVRGKLYKIDCYVRGSADDNCLGDFAIYFSKKFFVPPLNVPYPDSVILKPPANVQKEKDWYHVQFHYRASGEEINLVVGNFAHPPGYMGNRNAMVFIDEISMVPEDPREKPCFDYTAQLARIYAINDRHRYFEKEIAQKRELSLPSPQRNIVEREGVKDTLIVPDILFETDQYIINPKYVALLDSFCRAIKKFKVAHIAVEGHTDSVGTDEHNQELSINRATAVANYLMAHKAATLDQLEVNGFGKYRPVATNDTPDGRQQNRRVEIILFRK